jgi:hypothetical protein
LRPLARWAQFLRCTVSYNADLIVFAVYITINAAWERRSAYYLMVWRVPGFLQFSCRHDAHGGERPNQTFQRCTHDAFDIHTAIELLMISTHIRRVHQLNLFRYFEFSFPHWLRIIGLITTSTNFTNLSRPQFLISDTTPTNALVSQ